MDKVLLIKILVDFGLVILIWLVQLVIYPSFIYYDKSNLTRWHKIYMTRISFVVMPLMTMQLGLSAYLFYNDITFFNSINMGIISLIWLHTFIKAVPLHSQISLDQNATVAASKLFRMNRVRTLLWTVLFVYNIVVVCVIDSLFVNKW